MQDQNLRLCAGFDGTKESLADHSHRPKTEHPNAHTEQELKWIRDIHRRNSNAPVCEIYGKLRTNKGYSRHPGSLYRVYARLGFTKKEIVPTNKYKPQKNNAPTEIGVKWQLDVKYVPAACYTGSMPDKLCDKLGIKHQLIRPRTPRHNGKVERSHRLDQERFYNHMHFYS